MKKLIKRPAHNIFHFFIITIIVWLSFTCTAYAWLVYSKPEFRGRIIDAETKEPIEGVVVVVVYYDHTIVGGPGGGGTSVIKAKETLTDKKGDFHFPAYTTLMGPNSREDYARFIIFKQGYMSGGHASAPGPYSAEKFFSTDVIGKEGVLLDDTFPNTKPWKGILGVVELTRAKTCEERSKGQPDRPTNYSSKKIPLLFKAVNQDRKECGWEGEVK